MGVRVGVRVREAARLDDGLAVVTAAARVGVALRDAARVGLAVGDRLRGDGDGDAAARVGLAERVGLAVRVGSVERVGLAERDTARVGLGLRDRDGAGEQDA
jgi:hypothetical protein